MSSGVLVYNADPPWDGRSLPGSRKSQRPLAGKDPKKKGLQSKPPGDRRLRHFAQDSFALLAN
jgi:hypothetical protein